MCDCAARVEALEQRVKALEDVNSVQPVESTKKKGSMLAPLSEFDQFWACYPRRVGKQAALKAFKNAQNRPRIDDLLAAIERAKHSEQWRKDGGQYIPLPTTWLNQGRWDDEPVQVTPVQPKAQVKVERQVVERQEYNPPPPEFWERVGRIGRGM